MQVLVTKLNHTNLMIPVVEVLRNNLYYELASMV